MTVLPKSLAAWEPNEAQRQLCRTVALSFGIDEFAIVGRNRRPPVVLARNAACWLLRARWQHLSSSMIGKVVGGRERSTVEHALDRADERRAWDAAFRDRTDALLAGLMPAPLPPYRGQLGLRPKGPPPPPPVRRVRARNDFGAEHCGTAEMGQASARFIAALRAAHPERFAA